MNTIRRIRKNAFMTQKQFAEKIGVHHTTIYYYESGQRNPSLGIVKKMIDFAKENVGMELKLEDFLDDK